MRSEIKEYIGEKEYTFYQFNATEGLKVWIKVVKIMGAPLGVIINNVIGNKDIGKIDLKTLNIEGVTKLLVENLDSDTTVDIIKQILSTVMIDGKRVSEIFDVHFQGKYSLLFKVVYKALEVNYKDFLLDLVGQAGFKSVAE